MTINTCDIFTEMLLDGGYWINKKRQIILKTNIFYWSFVFDYKIIYKKIPKTASMRSLKYKGGISGGISNIFAMSSKNNLMFFIISCLFGRLKRLKC